MTEAQQKQHTKAAAATAMELHQSDRIGSRTTEAEPPYLQVGTDVSAKYKGAFCEAKIKKVQTSVKVKVTFAGKGPSSGATLPHDHIKGPLRVGAQVEAKLEKGDYKEATITKIIDASQYTVVFDDGDETTLKRTALCLKSGKHYAESESLDHLPLTNPEHFGNPVAMPGPRGRRSVRRRAAGLANQTNYALNLSDNEDGESADLGSVDDEDDSASTMTQQSEQQAGQSGSKDAGSGRDPDIGRVIIAEFDKRGSKAKDTWFPGLIVLPDCHDKPVGPDEYMIKSFKDSRYFVIPKKDTREYERRRHQELLQDASGTTLKAAVEKATAYLTKQEVPSNWDLEKLLGHDPTADALDADTGQESAVASSELDSAADEDFDDDDEPEHEESDRFIAQLIKFMDERATPLNKFPTIGSRDLDLYRLYRTVSKMGGFNKITSKNNWKSVYSKMGLPPPGHNGGGESLESMANALKSTYKKYLLQFHDFYRKLGGLNLALTPSSRGANARPTRNERGWRDRHDSGKEQTPAKTTRRKKSTNDEDIAAATASKIKKESKEEEESQDQAADDQEELDKTTGSIAATGRRNSTKRRGKVGRKKSTPKNDQDEGADTDPDDNEDPQKSAIEPGKFECIGPDVDVSIGDRMIVLYGKVKPEGFEAKCLKVDKVKDRYYVHYNGWNVRYDEWVKRHRIIRMLTADEPKNGGRDKTPRRPQTAEKSKATTTPVKPELKDSPAKTEPEISAPKTSTGSTGKRGRPPSAATVRANLEANIKREAASASTLSSKSVVPKAATTPTSASKRSSRRLDAATGDGETDSQQDQDSLHESTSSRLSREDSVTSIKERDDRDRDDRDEDKADSKEVSKHEPQPAEAEERPTREQRREASRADTSEDKLIERSDSQNSKKGVTPLPDEDDDRRFGKRKRGASKEPPIVPKEEPKEQSKDDKRSEKKKQLANLASKEKEAPLPPTSQKDQPPSPEDDSPKKKKSRKSLKSEKEQLTKEKEQPLEERASKLKSSKGTSRLSKEESPPESSSEAMGKADLEQKDEPTDFKHKRKRLAATTAAKSLSKEPSIEKEEPLAKKRSKRDPSAAAVEKTDPETASQPVPTAGPPRKDDEDTNQEIARLFDDDSSKSQSAASEKSLVTPGGGANEAPETEAGGFLLCAEEVPLSPVHPHNEDTIEDPSTVAGLSSQGFGNGSSSHKESVDASANTARFTPPTTPDSMRSNLSSLTPPYDSHDQHHSSAHHHQEVGTHSRPNQLALKNSAATSASNSDIDQSEKGPRTPGNVRSPPGGVSEDSCSQPGHDSQDPGKTAEKKSPATHTPKKRMRGRKRTLSTSENQMEREKPAKHERTPIKTRGATGRRAARAKAELEADRMANSPQGHSHLDLLAHHSSTHQAQINLAQYTPNAFLKNITVTSKYNFCTPIDETIDADKRISILTDRLSELRRTYQNIKTELQCLERRRKKCKRKEKERASRANSPHAGASESVGVGTSKKLLDRSTSSEQSDEPSKNANSSSSTIVSSDTS